MQNTMMRNNKGFSLLEFSLALGILGLLIAGILQVYNVEKQTQMFQNTESRLSELGAALALFFAENGHYPCPASMTVTMDDPQHGRMACPDLLPSDPNYIPSGTCSGGVCRVDGARDLDTDGDFSDHTVLIGAIPYKELTVSMNMSAADVSDSWLNQFRYVVTDASTDPSRYDYEEGLIDVKTSTGSNLTVVLDDGTAEGTGHLIILSHGDTGKGAFTMNGVPFAPCEGDLGSGGTLEGENCDLDAFFISYRASQKIRATVPGASNFFDDFVNHEISHFSRAWTQSPLDPDNIVNKNPGNIGIGLADPDDDIDVNGNIRAQEVRFGRFCNESYGNCTYAPVIGGSRSSGDGIGCSGNYVMSGVSNNTARCIPALTMPPNFTPPPPPCPSGEYVTGITAAGAIICNPL